MGQIAMKPTVSGLWDTDPTASPRQSWRVVVSSVANSWSAAYARAFTRALNSGPYGIGIADQLMLNVAPLALAALRIRWRLT